MENNIKALQQFLDSAHSVYHAVAALVWNLEDEGYICLTEGEEWLLQPGGKYYLTRGGSALVAFRIPLDAPCGFLMTAGHADRPNRRPDPPARLCSDANWRIPGSAGRRDPARG